MSYFLNLLCSLASLVLCLPLRTYTSVTGVPGNMILPLSLIFPWPQPNCREDKIVSGIFIFSHGRQVLLPIKISRVGNYIKKIVHKLRSPQNEKFPYIFMWHVWNLCTIVNHKYSFNYHLCIHLKLAILSLQWFHTPFNIHPSSGLIYRGTNHHILFRGKSELNKYKDTTFI